jgi:hypothetical protein
VSTKSNRNGKRSTLLTALFTVTAFWAVSGSQAEAQSAPGTLDMAGDWTFSSGFSPGLQSVNGYWIPVGLATVYQVHFDLEGPTEHGMRYTGYYLNVGGPFSQPGTLVAETFDGQGVSTSPTGASIPTGSRLWAAGQSRSVGTATSRW